MNLFPMLKPALGAAAALLTALILTGCGGGIFGARPYQEVSYYALRPPAPLAGLKYDLDISSFRLLAAGRNKMVYRDSSCRVLIDDYNKWVQSPSLMLRQYLQGVFVPGPMTRDGRKAVELRLHGTLVTFEIDLQSQEVVLGVDYSIEGVGRPVEALQGSRIIREKYSQQSPDQFAEAMSRAAASLAKFIAADAAMMCQRVLAAQAQTDAAK